MGGEKINFILYKNKLYLHIYHVGPQIMYNDLKDNSVELIDFFTNVCYCDKNCNVRILLFELQPSFHLESP